MTYRSKPPRSGHGPRTREGAHALETTESAGEPGSPAGAGDDRARRAEIERLIAACRTIRTYLDSFESELTDQLAAALGARPPSVTFLDDVPPDFPESGIGEEVYCITECPTLGCTRYKCLSVALGED